jgi:hypothetical protein
LDSLSHDEGDLDRLFRENDDLGPDSSLWLRPLRQLFQHGKPVGQVVALTVSPVDQLKLPFGMLTQTEKHRLIFWPILPSGANMICAGETVDVFDHITLEFPSERIHVTAYDANRQPIHVARCWRAHHFSKCDLALWFTLLVRVSILRQQAMAVQRRVQTPTTDKERRTDEFIRFTQHLAFSNMALPLREAVNDYIYFGVYLGPDAINPNDLSPSILPADSSMDSQIEGWPHGNVFQIAISRLKFRQRSIFVATACPPGRLRSDVFVGFPRGMNS